MSAPVISVRWAVLAVDADLLVRRDHKAPRLILDLS
jgi:hypothetical protein